MKKVKKPVQGDEAQLDEHIEKEIDAEISKIEEAEQPSGRRLWRKRLMYIFGAIALFIFMPYFLVFLGDFTGATAFTDIYGPLVFWNELSAPAFLLGFVSICVFTAVIMYLIMRSFDVQEGAW